MVRWFVYLIFILKYIFILLQDTEELFNFVDLSELPKNKNIQESRKRRSDENSLTTNFCFIKTPMQGYKIIRIEVYDAKKFDSIDDTICKCKAELCVQHVVKGVLFDEIYTSTCDIISKIQQLIERNSL